MVLTAEQEARLTDWAGGDTTTDGLLAAIERAEWDVDLAGLRAETRDRDALAGVVLEALDILERPPRQPEAKVIIAALDAEGVGDA